MSVISQVSEIPTEVGLFDPVRILVFTTRYTQKVHCCPSETVGVRSRCGDPESSHGHWATPRAARGKAPSHSTRAGGVSVFLAKSEVQQLPGNVHSLPSEPQNQ